MKAIGIDIGTTTISAVVIRTDNGELIQSKTIPNESFLETKQEWERIQDVAYIIQKAKEVLDGFLADYDDISSIGLTGQMHGILYLDREGRCISPLYTWQDGRGNQILAEGKTLAEELREKYGVKAATGYGLVTHCYNSRKNLVPKEAVSFCTISDYLGMVLTGRRTPLLHASMAASLGFFDERSGNFMRVPIKAEQMDETLLPEVTDQVAVLGRYQGISVTAALGDNQASFLGSVGMSKQTILLNMGTGGQISVWSDRYFEAPGIEARPFLDGTYLLVGSSLCGGRAYAALEKFFRSYVASAGGPDEEQYETMARLARAGEQLPDPMVVTTTFQGTRVNPAARGSIHNLGVDNFTPEGMVYGVLVGMAQELYHMYRVIHQGTGIAAQNLVASGNGLRKNPILQRIFTQMFEAPLTMAPYQEEAAYGAAISSR